MAPSVENSSFYCIPEPGKINPKIPFGRDLPRVKYKGQKGHTCFFYAFQILRDHQKIGKNPSPELLKERKIELAISNHRKRMTHIQLMETYEKGEISDFVADLLGKPCKKSDVTESLINEINEYPKDVRKVVNQALESFREQNEYDDFAIFCDNMRCGTDTYWLALTKVHEKLFRDLEIPLEKVHNSIPLYRKKTWDEIEIDEKHAHEMKYTYEATRIAYGAKYSSWHPSEPISKLIEHLKLYGPHLISGEFGRLNYEDPPSKSQYTLKGRPLFSWKPGCKRPKMTFDHAIVVVGAIKQNDKEIVYYIDPVDASEDAKTQKIYMISMQRLRLSIKTFGSFTLDLLSTYFEEFELSKESERVMSWAIHF